MAVTLPNMKVIRLKRAKILLRKVRGRVGGGESKFVPAPHRQANACKIFRLLGAKSLLGNFTNFKTFFPVVSLACLCQKLKKKKNGMAYPERGTLLGCASQYRSL